MPDAGPKLLIVDGNNMCHRVYWTHQGLSYKGKSTGVLYGFFRQLVHLHKAYPDHFRVVAWDGGYARRLEESQKGVEAGIIPSVYKANRKDKTPEELEELAMVFEQMDQLREVLGMVKCVQSRVEGVEADDVINSYADYAEKWGGEAIVVSSDKDFYQILRPGVKIYDAMKDETWTDERFTTEFGFVPPLWVDVGAIQGDHCLAKGTMVPMLDGTIQPVERLAAMGRFWVYSCDDKGGFVPAQAVCKRTGVGVPVVRVLLDNGRWVRCTKSHRWMMRDGSLKTADCLKSGDSLMPFHVRVNRGGYRDVFDNVLLRWKRVYEVVAKNCSKDEYERCVARAKNDRDVPVVHHRDFNKLNNAPKNLLWMTLMEHLGYPCGLNRSRWADKDYRVKMMRVCSKAGKIGGKTTWQRHRGMLLKVVAAVGVKTGAVNLIKYNKSDANKPKARANILRFLRDDDFKQRRVEAAKKRANTGEAKARMARIGWKTCLRMNNDGVQIEKQLFGKVRKIVEAALMRFGVVNGETYGSCWEHGGMSWTAAVDRFGQEKVMSGLNHKVVGVVDDGVSDVYDLQVDELHMFALDAGVFVHNSDNIHGVDGWGPVTTCKYVREHGGVDAVLSAVRAKDKRTKKEEVLLESEPRIRLARSLKQMDMVSGLPRTRVAEAKDVAALRQFFVDHGFMSLMKEAWRLV